MLFTKEELQEAYDMLIKKARAKIITPMAFIANDDDMKDPSKHSLLSVGADGIATIQFEKNKDQYLNEIERLLNQCELGAEIPRINFKKYQVVEKITPAGKVRKIVKLCLRDQVVMRAVLKKLTGMKIISGDYNTNFNVQELVTDLHQDMCSRQGGYTIVRTDIQNFYPSVNIDLLLRHFKNNCCKTQQAMAIYHLLRKALIDNKSHEQYQGLPIGMSVSGLLGEYYLAMAAIHDFGPGIKLYRFADDCLFILDENIEPTHFLQQLSNRLATFSLTCSPLKTQIFTNEKTFDFVGIHFEAGKVSIDAKKTLDYKRRIKEDIEKEFKFYRLFMTGMPGFIRPANKVIVRSVLKEHQNGKRSRMWGHVKKIEGLNE